MAGGDRSAHDRQYSGSVQESCGRPRAARLWLAKPRAARLWRARLWRARLWAARWLHVAQRRSRLPADLAGSRAGPKAASPHVSDASQVQTFSRALHYLEQLLATTTRRKFASPWPMGFQSRVAGDAAAKGSLNWVSVDFLPGKDAPALPSPFNWGQRRGLGASSGRPVEISARPKGAALPATPEGGDAGVREATPPRRVRPPFSERPYVIEARRQGEVRPPPCTRLTARLGVSSQVTALHT